MAKACARGPAGSAFRRPARRHHSVGPALVPPPAPGGLSGPLPRLKPPEAGLPLTRPGPGSLSPIRAYLAAFPASSFGRIEFAEVPSDSALESFPASSPCGPQANLSQF